MKNNRKKKSLIKIIKKKAQVNRVKVIFQILKFMNLKKVFRKVIK